MQTIKKPELLAPAGNLERLKVAVRYGADAVYLGGQCYGLRARADNFTETEIIAGVEFAHAYGAAVFVTLNAFLHDEDFHGLEEYCQFLEQTGVDAVIISDLGVLAYVKCCSNLTIHLSTQASCLNVASAKLWKAMGATRIVVGRELSAVESGKIKTEAGIEVEMFSHGAMCMSYSGNCTISNFTAGRDSNRGGCIQSCRYVYTQKQNPAFTLGQPAANENSLLELNVITAPTTEPLTTEATFMSSKDLNAIEAIETFFKHGITSLKLEGRMKSPFYVASTVRAYRLMIDAYAAGQTVEKYRELAENELQAIPHRGYTEASLFEPAGEDSIYSPDDPSNEPTSGESYRYLGMVLDQTDDYLVMRLNSPLASGDTLNFLPFSQPPISLKLKEFVSIDNQPIDFARQESVVKIPRNSSLATIEPLCVARLVEGVS